MLKQKIKKIWSGILSVTLIAGILLPFGIAENSEAAAPRFNFLQGDYELRRGANVTRGDSVRGNPVTGNPGDVFEVAVYYHNGVVDTTAQNTRIKVSMPSETTNKQAIINASISANNADTVTNTVVNGQIVGLPNLQINLADDAKLEYIPGSAKWYPNFTDVSNPPSSLLSGQNGSELFSAEGLKIGDIDGCWQYVGYVIFQFKTVKHLPQIIKSKIAKNLVSGVAGTDINANPGDVVEYTLTTKNTGQAATDFVVTDDLSDVLEYSDISFISDGGTVSNGVVTYPSVSISAGATISRTFKVKVKNPLPNVPQNGTHFDYTMQNVYGNEVLVRLPKPTIGKVNLTIVKDVRNFTLNEINFVDENRAKAGDTLEYRIGFSNTGTLPADGVVVSDVLPQNVQYLPGTTIISINNGQERTVVDGITGNGINIGMLAAGDSGYIKFKALISRSVAAGATLKNSGYLKWQTVVLCDTATTVIVKDTVPLTPTYPELPKTGAESWIITLMILAAGATSIYYFKFKKTYKKKLAQF